MSHLNSILSCLSWLSRIVLAAVFIYGGVPKLLAPGEFAGVISAYGLLPDSLIFPAAIFLPLAEVATAVGLVFNCRWSTISAIVLLLVFIAVLSYGIALGLDVDCGCFGPEDPEHGVMSNLEEARIRDLLFLVPAGYLAFFIYKQKKE